MKKASQIFLLTILHSILALAQPSANTLLPRIDSRVELLTIVFKLADVKDLNDTLNPVYSKAIHNHFGKYANHSLIKYARTLVDSIQHAGSEFGYWEIPALAVHLSQPPKLDPVFSFQHTGSDDVWDNRSLLQPRLIRLLKEFYKEADCESFFNSQASYYEAIHQQYYQQSVKLNKEWVDNFFSLRTTENYFAILGLGFRAGAYLRVNFENNNRDTFTVFGCTAFDLNGIPTTFSDQMFPRTLLHEYIHAYSNQLIDTHAAALQKPSASILANPEVFKIMENTFYGNWKFLLYESLVRAVSIKYRMTNKEIATTLEQEIAIEEQAGFFWIKGLVNELNSYERTRNVNRNLDAYMPQLIRYFEKVAAEMKND